MSLHREVAAHEDDRAAVAVNPLFAQPEQVPKHRLPDASMTDWLNNDIINRLRQQYTDAKRQVAAYAARLGPGHQGQARVMER